jgi:hypothetical protein
MRKSILFSIVIAMLFIKCKPELPISPDPNYSGGPYKVNGVIMLFDTLSGNYTYNTVASLPVYIKYSEDLTGYLYPASTSASGLYSFSGISGDRAYTVYSRKDSNGIKYYGELAYAANTINSTYRSDTLKLYPSSTYQNGIHLIVFDDKGARVSNVTAWVFNNPNLFSATADSVGKLYTMTTNGFGVDNKLNIPPNTYYLRIKTKIGNVEFKGEGQVSVSASGIKDCVINLTRNQNGFELLISDVPGAPVANAQVYVYQNATIEQLDSDNSQWLYSTNSDSKGIASLYNIDPGLYYVKAIKKVGNVTLKGETQINVSPGSINKSSSVTIK